MSRFPHLAPRPPSFDIVAATIHTATAEGTTTYQLRDNPRIRGPVRYRRATPDADPPAQNTPCLAIVLDGDLDDAWVIPFP